MHSRGFRILVIGTGPEMLKDFESSTPLCVTVASPGAARSWLSRDGSRTGIEAGSQFDCIVCRVADTESEIGGLLRDLGENHPARPVVAVGPTPPATEELPVDAVIPSEEIRPRLKELLAGIDDTHRRDRGARSPAGTLEDVEPTTEVAERPAEGNTREGPKCGSNRPRARTKRTASARETRASRRNPRWSRRTAPGSVFPHPELRLP